MASFEQSQIRRGSPGEPSVDASGTKHLQAAVRALPASWEYIEQDNERIDFAAFEALRRGDVGAIKIRKLIDRSTSNAVVQRIHALAIGSYAGMREALGTLWPNHWVPRYVDGSWDSYFATVDEVEQQKEEVFTPFGRHPFDQVSDILYPAFGNDLDVLSMPSGKRFHRLIVRAGTPALHYDDGRYDLPRPIGKHIRRQYAVNFYLQNPGGGELVVYRRRGGSPGFTKALAQERGISWFGNYDIPERYVEGVPRATVPISAGDFVIFRSQNFHKVATVIPPERAAERIAISSHIAELDNGDYAAFS